ncbi:MAG: hypothetical protein AAFY29_02010 [Pseudomonadota bacterium]
MLKSVIAILFLVLAAFGAPASVASCAHNIQGDWQLDVTRFALNASEDRRAKILAWEGGEPSLRVMFESDLLRFYTRQTNSWGEPQESNYRVVKEYGSECELLVSGKEAGEDREARMHIRFDGTGFCFLVDKNDMPYDCYIRR